MDRRRDQSHYDLRKTPKKSTKYNDQPNLTSTATTDPSNMELEMDNIFSSINIEFDQPTTSQNTHTTTTETATETNDESEESNGEATEQGETPLPQTVMDDGRRDLQNATTEHLQPSPPPHSDPLTQLLTLMQEMRLNIDNKFEQTNQTLHQTNQNLQQNTRQLNQLELSHEQTSQQLNAKFEQTNQTLQQTTQQLNKLEKSHEQSTQQLSDRIELSQQQSNIQMGKFKTELKQSMIEALSEIEIKFNESLIDMKTEILSETENKLTDLKTNLQQEIKISNQNIRSETGKYLQDSVLPQIQLCQQEIKKNQTQISEIQAETGENKRMQQHIHVTCTGSNNETILTNTPKFNGRNTNPMEFIDKLKTYYSKTTTKKMNNGQTQEEILQETVDNALEHSALRWWDLIREEITDWRTFEIEFTKKFWSRDVQRGIRQKLEYERYRPGGRLTRTEYFIERVLVMKGMTPRPDEMEIIDVLAEQFETRIQDARRVQNLQTVRDFAALLQREDVTERNDHIRQRNETSNTKNNSNRPEPRQERRGYERNDNRTHPYQQRNRPDYKNNYNRQGNYNNNSQNYRQQSYQNYNRAPGPVATNYQNYSNRPDYQNNNFNRPNYQNYDRRPEAPSQQRTPPDRRTYTNHYPTNEQNQLCHMIATTSNPTPSLPRAAHHSTPTHDSSPTNSAGNLNATALAGNQ